MDSALAVGLCLVQTHFKLYRAATSKKKQDQGLLARKRLESGPSDMAQMVGIMLSLAHVSTSLPAKWGRR